MVLLWDGPGRVAPPVFGWKCHRNFAGMSDFSCFHPAASTGEGICAKDHADGLCLFLPVVEHAAACQMFPPDRDRGCLEPGGGRMPGAGSGTGRYALFFLVGQTARGRGYTFAWFSEGAVMGPGRDGHGPVPASGHGGAPGRHGRRYGHKPAGAFFGRCQGILRRSQRQLLRWN